MRKSTSGADSRLETLHTALVEKTEALTSSEAWTEYLRFAGQFHRYSANNVLLIMLQRPDATRVASYRKWQEVGRQVRKGEQSIGIFAPMTRKRTDGLGEEHVYVSGFKVVSVFDVSQTDGDALPDDITRPTLLQGEAPAGLWDSLAAIVTGAGYTLQRGPSEHGEYGFTSPGRKLVQVTEGLSALQSVKTLAHEVGHLLLHTDDEDLTDEARAHRGVAEVEAESVAFLVLADHGVETDAYSLPYVAGWSDGKHEVIAKTAERVIRTAREVLTKTNTEHLEEVAA